MDTTSQNNRMTSDILSTVRELRKNIIQKYNKVKFIAIAGGRGSGKSTITRVIKEYFKDTKEVSLINMKHFLRDLKPNIRRACNG